MKLYRPLSLCESTANWQPVITTHLPCSASALRSSLSSEQNHGIFLNWPLGNSIYSRAVAAEFAPQSVLAKLAWKLQIKSQSSEFYYSLGTNDAFEQSPRGPNRKLRDRVSAQVSRIQDGPPCSCSALSTTKTRANQTNWYRYIHRALFGANVAWRCEEGNTV